MLRRHLWRWLTIAMLATLATAAAAPTTASAAPCAPNAPGCQIPTCSWGDGGFAPPTDCNVVGYRTATLGHVGWTYLNLNYCAPGMACIALYRESMAAWSWSGTAWRPSSLRQGWVYVYPYTGAWRWAWTQSTGWVAVNSGRFELRPF